MTPPDIAPWPGIELGKRLSGGVRNPVYRARRRTEDFVVRVSGRAAESLDWELDLLEMLHSHGVVVPRTMSTSDGRRHHQGVLVQRFILGREPRDGRDWSRVVAALTVVHEVSEGWPQRPGFASARELLVRDKGGDVDLAAMPATAASLVRASWLPVLDAIECAVHGDMGAGNVLVTDDHAALIDWDEARVDVPAFDFAHLPQDVEVPGSERREALVTAGVAWEAATCWVAEPAYAARRVTELQAALPGGRESDR